jgi:hypothetical protein
MHGTRGSSPAPIRELRDGMNRLRAGLFSSIEAVGLPDKQEVALKGLIRQLSYDAQANIESALRRGSD